MKHNTTPTPVVPTTPRMSALGHQEAERLRMSNVFRFAPEKRTSDLCVDEFTT
jgi:hypothetical protein